MAEIKAQDTTSLASVKTVNEAAQQAKTSADSARQSANSALADLSTIENVVGTLNWITAHGTMTSQAGGTFDPNKVYFVADPTGDYVVGGNHYSVVAEPVAEDIDNYYVLTVDESVQNYVATHIVVDQEGLWIIPDAGGNKVLIATGSGSTYTTAGTYIISKINNVDTVVATFSAGSVEIGKDALNSVIKMCKDILRITTEVRPLENRTFLQLFDEDPSAQKDKALVLTVANAYISLKHRVADNRASLRLVGDSIQFNDLGVRTVRIFPNFTSNLPLNLSSNESYDDERVYTSHLWLGEDDSSGNSGIYSISQDKWLFHQDSQHAYLNNGEVRTDRIVQTTQLASGHETYSSIATNSYADKSVSFGKTFASAPNVVACLSTSGTAGNIGNVSVSVFNITTTGCTIRVFNNRGGSLSPAIEWIAVGI